MNVLSLVLQSNRKIPNPATDFFHVQRRKSQLQGIRYHSALAVVVHRYYIHITLRSSHGGRLSLHPTAEPSDGLQPSFDA